MEITDIRIRKSTDDIKVKAYVTITLDDCFAVHNIKIIDGLNGTFIAMPSRKLKTGEYKDVAHPINPEYRKIMETKILDKYKAGEFEEKMPDRNY